MLKGEIRRQALLEAAETLFFEKGYNQTTVQELVDAFSCSKGSFYHYFESKLEVLSQVCAARAEKSFAEYQAMPYKDEMERLNGLLYYAMPFRAGEEGFVGLLLPLGDTPEGDMALLSILRAQRTLVLPELNRVLSMLRAAGTVHYRQPLLPDLLWDCYAALYGKLLRQAQEIARGGPTAPVAELLEAARFLFERLLDAPFSGVRIVGAQEALSAVSHAVERLRRQREGEQAP